MRQLKVWGLEMFLGMPSGARQVAGESRKLQEGVARLQKTVSGLQQQTNIGPKALLARTFFMSTPRVVPLVERIGGQSLSSDRLKCAARVSISKPSPPGYSIGAVLFGVDLSGVFTEIARTGRVVGLERASGRDLRVTEGVVFKGVGLMANRTYVVALSLLPRWLGSSKLLLGRTVSFHVPWPFERFLTAPFPRSEKVASHMARDTGIQVRPRLVQSRGAVYLRIQVQVPGRLRGSGRWLVVETSTGHGQDGRGADRWTEFRYALPLDRATWVMGDVATTNLDPSRPLRRPEHAWILVRAAVVWPGHIRFSERRLHWSETRRKWL